jgi:phage terminase Nu1 subunit (DNA packaging protein)
VSGAPATITHDAAAALLQVSPDQLTRLVGEGVVRRFAPGKYVPAQIIRDYIAHLSAAEARFDGLRGQAELAAHLDMSERNLREVLGTLGLDHKVASQREVRVAYIRYLRETAAGHRAGDGTDLVAERVQTERVSRQLMLLNLAEKQGALIHVEQLRPMYAQMIGAFKTELLALPDKLKAELDALHGINVDAELLNAHVRAALEQLSRYDPGDPNAADGAGAEPAPA